MNTYSALIFKAMEIAYKSHEGQLDKSGMPYIFHPAYLASQMETEQEIIVALLHDVVEDTEVTFEDLEKEGFPSEVMEAIKLITHNDYSPYFDYIRRVAGNPISRKVKLADLHHNGNPTRTRKPEHDSPGLQKRMERYPRAIEMLEEADDL